MATPFLAEIRIMSFNFPPKGWALTNGQFLPINQNQALFALLGTTYGGNGQTNFALPELRGRVPIHQGSGHSLGQQGGSEAHTLTLQELPTHAHVLNASTQVATANTPSNTLVTGQSTAADLYAAAANFQAMSPSAVANAGGSQPHNNMQPCLTLTFCIALQGIFPSRN